MGMPTTCSHGVAWNAACEDCQYVWDKGTIESFGPMVSAARSRMAIYEQKRLAAVKPAHSLEPGQCCENENRPNFGACISCGSPAIKVKP